MPVTNIELYEALKKDLSEDSARMIAEVVPPAAEIATKSDISRLDARITQLEGHIDSRLLRYTFAFIVPIWVSAAGLLVALVAKL